MYNIFCVDLTSLYTPDYQILKCRCCKPNVRYIQLEQGSAKEGDNENVGKSQVGREMMLALG